jgi:hypothetical protein
MNPKLASVRSRSKKILQNKILYLLYFILSFSSYTVNPILNLVSVPCLVGGVSMRSFGGKSTCKVFAQCGMGRHSRHLVPSEERTLLHHIRSRWSASNLASRYLFWYFLMQQPLGASLAFTQLQLQSLHSNQLLLLRGADYGLLESDVM